MTRSVKHNSLISLPFEFSIRSKWFNDSLKLTIICFFRFVIREAFNESCDTGRDQSKVKTQPHIMQLSMFRMLLCYASLKLNSY